MLEHVVNMFCHTRAGAWVKVRLCLLLQVGLLKCTFPSGSLIALVGLDSEMGVGLLNGHLLVGLLSGGGEYFTKRPAGVGGLRVVL